MKAKRFINKVLDYNKFTLENYREFLFEISRFVILPLNEFNEYHNKNQVVIGLRHDIDSNFTAAQRMSQYESFFSIKSSYFYLHTAKYCHKPEFINSLFDIQNEGHEIGIHNDLLSINDSQKWLFGELDRMRRRGLNITGTSAHGRDKRLGSNNLEFWQRNKLEDYGLKYEAYSLDYSRYYSDCRFINGHRWHPSMVDWSKCKDGDRIQILIHPEHWH